MSMNCLHLRSNKCILLKVKECPENCSFICTNPKEYFVRVKDLLKYNQSNSQSCADLRKELKYLKEKFGDKRYEGWQQVYEEDKRRGSGGGHSEGGANTAGIKQKMKDNSLVKPSPEEKREYKKALNEWEEEHGQLDRLGRSSMGKGKIDSYTGEKI